MTVIFNQGSGLQKGHEPIRDALREAGVEANLVPTTGKHLRATAAAAAKGDDDLIVAAGGDGTINTVAEALAGTGKTLGVLPRGTFNFFARKLNIPVEPGEALAVLANGVDQDVDIGEVNGRIFINNASIGIYPHTLREREEAYRKFGRKRIIAYISGAAALVRGRRQVMNLRLAVDGNETALRSQFVFVCNNRDQLDFYNIRGGDWVDRGALAVYTAPPLKVTQWLRLGVQMLLRRLDKADELVAIRARDLWIETRKPKVEVALDGERVVMTAPLHFRIRQNGLRVRVPRAEAVAA